MALEIRGEALMALGLIFKGSLTKAPKEREDRNYDSDRRNDYGYTHVSFGHFPGDKTIVSTKSARTVETFLAHAEKDNAVFYLPNTLRTASAEKRSNEAVRWINTIVIDIDDPALTLKGLFENIEAAGLPKPTLVNKTPKGFHVYWILSERVPGYKSARALYSLIAGLMCDVLPGADHGSKAVSSFKRIPRNIDYFDPESTYELRDLQEWYNLNKKTTSKTKAYDKAVGTGKNILDTKAFKILSEGCEDGQRNLAAFCLAKLYRRAGYDYDETFECLLEWNMKNAPALSVSALRGRVKSAFRNRDMIPSKLIKELTGESIARELFWVNHAKDRQERERDPKGRIHISEWIQDIEKLIEADGVWEGKQHELAELLNAPERSIKKALKQIRDDEHSRISVHTTIGRGARTTLSLKTVEDDASQGACSDPSRSDAEKEEIIKGAQSLNHCYKGWRVGESNAPRGGFGSPPYRVVGCGPSGACVQVDGFTSCAQIQKSTTHAPGSRCKDFKSLRFKDFKIKNFRMKGGDLNEIKTKTAGVLQSKGDQTED